GGEMRTRPGGVGLGKRRKGHAQGSNAQGVWGRYPRGAGHTRSVRATDHRPRLGDAGAGTDGGHPAEVCAGHRRATEKAGERQLADVSPHYDGWGYSPLEEINRDNVSRLQPVWSFATGQTEGHQAPPIVNNGVMFVATP